MTWRGDSAKEDGCLRGRNPWDPAMDAYIHAHPFLIVGIDTIPSDDGGHRGMGGGNGEDQG